MVLHIAVSAVLLSILVYITGPCAIQSMRVNNCAWEKALNDESTRPCFNLKEENP